MPAGRCGSPTVGDDVLITDQFGKPLKAAAPKKLAGVAPNVPYDAADLSSGENALWRPALWSTDNELNLYRDRIVSRVRDMVRNDGWSSGIITRLLDNTIGGSFRPVPKPDYKFLAAYTGNKGFDADWARAYASWAKARYRVWAESDGRYCDAGRRLTMPQMYAVGFRHKLIDGDALSVAKWLPSRIAIGRAMYATCFELVDPDRLSNPQNQMDLEFMRGGVEIDREKAAVAYHVRKAHQGEWWAGADTVTWERIPRETDWGRRIVIHDFETGRADQHRGGAGVLTPVLTRLKMLFRYDGAELEAALLNAIFSAYIESPFDHGLLAEAMGDGEVDIGAYQEGRADFHHEKRTSLNGARIPTLYPGEALKTVTAARPSGNFADFEKAVLRNAASAAGASAQQASNDWSDVNYSSARGALLEFWKTTIRRRTDFAVGFAQPHYGTWLEEAHDLDDPPLPPGAPPFHECRDAYSRASWLGPGIGWMDPVDEPAGAILRLDGSLTTMGRELGEHGQDLEETLEERAADLALFKEHGLDPPSWAQHAVPAREAAKKPEQAKPE